MVGPNIRPILAEHNENRTLTNEGILPREKSWGFQFNGHFNWEDLEGLRHICKEPNGERCTEPIPTVR